MKMPLDIMQQVNEMYNNRPVSTLILPSLLLKPGRNMYRKARRPQTPLVHSTYPIVAANYLFTSVSL